MLFRNVRIADSNVIVCDDSDDFLSFCTGGPGGEGQAGDDAEQEEANKREFLESLFILEGGKERDPTKPDFVIKKRGCETRIFLDE